MTPATIKLVKLHKSYYLSTGEEIPVLRGVDLEVQPGEFIALMGESGCGKTTLLNIIGCLHQPSSGEYYLSGEAVGQIDQDYVLAYIRNKKMGFIFQQFNLFPRLSALKNVSLPALYAGQDKDRRDQRAHKLLADLGLGSRLHHKPSELSGGQQQRVAIARALMNEPSIILADEPTGALDSKSGLEIMDIFTKLKEEGKTIIMVTHTAEVAKYADRIVYMKDGQVVNNDYKLKSHY